MWSGPPTVTAVDTESLNWSVDGDQLTALAKVLTDQGAANAQYEVTARISAAGLLGTATSSFLIHSVPVDLGLPSGISSTAVVCTIPFTASSNSGVNNVQYTTDPTLAAGGAGTWSPVSQAGTSDPGPAGKPGDYSRAGLITLSSPSPNGTPAANSASTQVWFLCENGVLDANGQPETNQAVTTVTWHDKTAPAPTWLEPQDGAALELLGQGATPQVNVVVSIDDSAGGVVSAGVGAGDVTCSVDWNAPVSLVQETGTGLWSAVVPIPPEGDHLLALNASDSAGNSAPQQVRGVSVRRSGIQGVTEQDYLADLIDYIRSRLLTRSGAVAEVTAQHLEVALAQPFRQLSGAGATRVGTTAALTPINAVRGVIEVLRAYLMSRPPAPVAHWPLDDGPGATLARDDTGGGSDGTLTGITWAAGPPGMTAAAVFDGTSSSVTSESTQVQVEGIGPPTEASLTAWINPSRLGNSGGDPSGIVVLYGWAGLTLAANGHLVMTQAGGPPVDTGATITTGTWAHVAITYDGTNLTTYIDGAQAATMATGLGGDDSAGCAIGNSEAAGQFFEGAIADVGVYDVVLSAAEVRALAAPANQAGTLTPALAQSDYLAVVYEAILAGLGTSSEELRVATRAPVDPRAALAARLGISLAAGRPDQLDLLLLTSADAGANALNESNLQALFGLQPTDADPLAVWGGTPSLTQWRQAALRAGWMADDYATPKPTDYTAPIIDPDIVFDGDITNQTDPLGQAAVSLRDGTTGRVKWLADKAAGLTRPSAGTGLLGLVTTTLGVDVAGLAAQSAQGNDITGPLAAVPLAVDAFNRLATLSTLPDALTDDEWGDASAIIVQILKTRQFPQWRQEEQSLGLVLDPAIFTPQPLTPDQLPQWRATWTARVQWQQRLIARADQLTDLDASLALTTAGAEQAALPPLRDAILATAAPGSANDSTLVTPGDQLGLRLGLDLQVGPALTTTRCEQATNALAQLLASFDSTGGLPSSFGLPWTVNEGAVSKAQGSSASWFEAFQGELNWMSSYTQWSSAMTLFLYPENYLLPSIRTGVSAQFANLIANVTASSPPTSDQAAQYAAGTYWNDNAWGPDNPPGFDGLPVHETKDPPPSAPTQFPYTADLSVDQLNALKQGDANPKGNRETYFDLPLQLALSLRDAGAWEAALTWMRIIYDLDRPAGDRWIYDVTKIEGDPGSITRDDSWLSGGQLDPHDLAATRGNCYQRFALMTVAGILCDWGDARFAADTSESRAHAVSLYIQALQVLQEVQDTYAQTPVPFITTNPDLTALSGRATGALAQIRTGLNIAGMVRPLAASSGDSPAAPPATNFRYATLITRAQQLVTSAGQLEASYLASLQQKDNENYQQLLAQQDLTVASAQVQVAFDQATVASDQVQVAQLQVQRAQTQSDTYQSWIDAGPNQYEQDQLSQIGQEGQYQTYAVQAQQIGTLLGAAGSAAGAAVSTFGVGSAFDVAAGVAQVIAETNTYQAQQASLTSQSRRSASQLGTPPRRVDLAEATRRR